MRKTISLLLMAMLGATACNTKTDVQNGSANSKQQVADLLDSFNVAAGKAEYEKYFSYYADSSIFIGTDATERWNKQEFMVWAKPYFDRGRAWNFKSIKRSIYFDATGNLAWFDELLKTQMKICRGSGVVVKQGNEWKVKQYVLSMTLPNTLVDTVVKLKAATEDSLMMKMQ
jgi:hypothetical protein